MTSVSKDIVIAAPREAIFEVIDDLEHISDIWKNVSNVRNIVKLPNGAKSCQFDYTMAGIRIEGSTEVLAFEPPRRIVTRTRGGLISTLTWTLASAPGGTAVSLHVQYEVPVPVIGQLAEIIVAKVNEADLIYVLNRIKLKLELAERQKGTG